jgi:hypothetical protein
MERRGIPGMVVVSQPFALMAAAESKGQDLPDLEVLVVSHPIHTKTREQLDAEVDALMPQIRAFFGLPTEGQA